jgi:GTP cyclohydrolase I
MALDKSKINGKLGLEVKEYLIDMGVETPMATGVPSLLPQHKISNIKDNMDTIMSILGLDLTDDSLRETPTRIAKMYVNEIFYGLDYDNFPKITPFENKMSYDEMILERNISVRSTCEHHFITFHGHAHIAYIPNGHVLGLSKLNRIVDFFSRRPQVQERLTEQIYHALSYILDTKNIAVMIKAKHFCVVQRGVEDENSDMVTSKLGGCFKEQSVKDEFLKLISM